MRLLGEVLRETFGVAAESIEAALAVQREKGGRIGEILIQLRKISEDDLLSARSLQCGLDVVHSLPTDPDPFFVPRVPIGFLKKFKMMPIATPEASYIALAEPFYFQQADDLQRLLQWEGIRTVLTPQNEIFVAINAAYDTTRKDAADRVMQDMDEDDPESILSEIEETADLLDDTSDAPVIKLVNLVLSQAVRDGASDIHIESYKDRIKIRKRVDGILYDMYSPPRHVQGKLISRLKIMAKMDIAEKRLPQDGRIEIRLADKNIDIRVSTLPTSFGERVVMRLLDKSSSLVPLEDLGLSKDDLNHFMRMLKAPHGIILVTGPTGSGKTTTLYSALGILNNADINIITVEDPIEYQMNGISQVQVNPKIGLTFASGLRTIVRQDPDVILVGEIRDVETAEIAIQSALTGHLVFSTLHTNDAASAITRLIDMGVEPFLVSSAVNAIMAQRLVRKICPHCREAYTPANAYLERVGLSPIKFADKKLYRGAGCVQCLQTGYKGRIGIFELMSLTPAMKSLILTTSDAGQIKKQALSSLATGMLSLRQDGLRKVLAGLTTLEEVFRVT
ncbi:type II secretion system ATPase GspE [Desulfobulbus sp.]|jgi:general secretion pathway protein E|uniref:type II secretion system ATPase GspE n=1 Tax=Desulfobulbus sp. TaxID=895 RepID=UPI0027B99FD8|nr:type II secretion system ATPase GspE [Desulfobulbus sp.]